MHSVRILGANSGLSGGGLGQVSDFILREPVTDLPTATGGAAVVGVYENSDYTGTSLGLTVGLTKMRDLEREGLHDMISSFKVAEGYKLTAYYDWEGGGPRNVMFEVEGPAKISPLNDPASMWSWINYTNSASAIDVEPIGNGGIDTGNGTDQEDQGGATTGQVQQAGFSMGSPIMLVGGLGLLGAALYTVATLPDEE